MTKGSEEKQLSLLDRAPTRANLDRDRVRRRPWWGRVLLEWARPAVLNVCAYLGRSGDRSLEIEAVKEVKALVLARGSKTEKESVIRRYYRGTLFH